MEVREFLLNVGESEGEINLRGHVFSPVRNYTYF